VIRLPSTEIYFFELSVGMASFILFFLACLGIADCHANFDDDDCDETMTGTSLIQRGMHASKLTDGRANDREALGHWPSGRGLFGGYAVSQNPEPFDVNKSLAWSWHHPKGRFHTLTYGTAIDDNSNVYLSADDGIRKLSSDGDVLWEHLTLPAEVPNAGALYDGAFYNSDQQGYAFALDTQTGQPKWKRQVSTESGSIGSDNGFVMVHEGVVVLATDWSEPSVQGKANKYVRGLNATNGDILWTFSPDAHVWNFLALFPDRDSAVFQDMTGKAYRLRLTDGTLVWKNGGVEGTWTDGSIGLGSNGVVYTVANNLPPSGTAALTSKDAAANIPGTLSAFNVSDGKLLWKVTTPRPPNNAPAVGKIRKDGGLTVVLPVGQQVVQGAPTDVYAYDADTGKVQWVFNGPKQKGLLQAGDFEGLSVRLASNRPVCLPNGWSAPAIDGKGTVFVGNEEGNFYALRDTDGDGRVSGPQEVSSFDTLAAFSGSASPSLAPGMIAVASCDTLFVFKS